MNIMKKLKVLLGALSMLTLSAANAGTLVLDSFNYDPALQLSVDSGAGNSVSTGSVISVESGADADYTLTYLASGSGFDTARANFGSSGQLKYSEESGVNGKLDIEYSIAGGAVTLDFSGYDAFYFDVISIDGNGGFEVLLTLTDSDGTQISASYTITAIGTFIASFDDMMADADYADFDFSLVKSALTNITSAGNDDDFALGEVGLVPEPSALAILGLGLIGLGLRRRKLV
jgi:hypothetical protein